MTRNFAVVEGTVSALPFPFFIQGLPCGRSVLPGVILRHVKLLRRQNGPLDGRIHREAWQRCRRKLTKPSAGVEHMRDIRIAIDPELFSEAEQLRRIWGASLGTARRNEKARQQRLKNERAKRRHPEAIETVPISGSD